MNCQERQPNKMNYNPQPPTPGFADDNLWMTNDRPKEIATQCDLPYQSRKLKNANMYVNLIKRHWIIGKNKKRLRIILKNIAEHVPGQKVKHLVTSGLALQIKQIRKETKKDDSEIYTWAKELMNMWKRKFTTDREKKMRKKKKKKKMQKKKMQKKKKK